MVIACSYELSQIDNKENKKYLNDSTALHKSQVFQRFHLGNVSIYNHREDVEEPAEDPKPRFHLISCLRKF